MDNDWSALTREAHRHVSWARTPTAEQSQAMLDNLQKYLVVGLIEVKRKEFAICHPDEPIATVVERNGREWYDFLPVEDAGRIAGLFEIRPFMTAQACSGVVRDKVAPLSEDNLIGADACILTFVRDADIRRCRLVVSGEAISGLVTLSDLQQIPVRTALFSLVTHLETLMANVIRKVFGGTISWLPLLKDKRQDDLRKLIEHAAFEGDLIDPLLYTQFCDKREIIGSSADLAERKDEFEREFKAIEQLRNNLAHANEYAATESDAANTCATVRLIDKWTNEFLNWLQRAQSS